MSNQLSMSPEQLQVTPFEQMVGTLDLADFVVAHDRSKAVRHLNRFRLVPFELPAGHAFGPLDENVLENNACFSTFTDEWGNTTPYLDAPRAISLAYGEDYPQRIIAISAARYIPVEDVYIIEQIQDVTSVRKQLINGRSNREYGKTGLLNGMDWRATLIAAWQEVAYQHPYAKRLIVRSHNNVQWPSVKKHGYHAYDAVAQRMGFAQNYRTNDWEISTTQRKPARLPIDALLTRLQ